jgi:zinc transporter 2
MSVEDVPPPVDEDDVSANADEEDEDDDAEHHCGGGDHHGHAHAATAPSGTKKTKKSGFAIHAAFLHALGDCVQSVGVIAAGVFIYFANLSAFGVPTSPTSIYNLADPLSSIFFAVITLRMTKKLILDILAILMESTPQSVDYQDLARALARIPGVESVHDLHVWSLAADYTACSVHLVANNHVEVLHQAQRICSRRFHIQHHTIQVDPVAHGSDNCHHGGSCAVPTSILIDTTTALSSD